MALEKLMLVNNILLNKQENKTTISQTTPNMLEWEVQKEYNS